MKFATIEKAFNDLTASEKREKLLECDLRVSAFHEAAHAVVAREFGFSFGVEIYPSGNTGENERLVYGRCHSVAFRVREEAFEMLKAIEGPVPLSPEKHLIFLSGREKAMVCLSGWLAELLRHDPDLWCEMVIEEIDYREDGISATDLLGIQQYCSGEVDDPKFHQLIEDTLELLRRKWKLVEAFAEFLVAEYDEKDGAYLPGDVASIVLKELESEIEQS